MKLTTDEHRYLGIGGDGGGMGAGMA